MNASSEFPEDLNKGDFLRVATWIASGPRSILLSGGQGGLWWDKNFQLQENNNGCRELTTLTVYRPFVVQNGLTWSILRTCKYRKEVFKSVVDDRTLPAVEISYQRIEGIDPSYHNLVLELGETLLSEIRSPAVPESSGPQAGYVMREVSGWLSGDFRFFECPKFQGTLQKWRALVATVEASAHDEVTGFDLTERFETKPLCEPIDLPEGEVPFFYRYIDEWRMFFDDDD